METNQTRGVEVQCGNERIKLAETAALRKEVAAQQGT
jgi:hypothetical protein